MSSEIFLISDPHFGHEGVIKFGERPFNDTAEMNEEMIDRWNKVVSKRDVVICLGDWSMKADQYRIAERLKGLKRLVLGNHDTSDLRHLMKYFHSIHGSLFKYDMLMTHIPVMMDKYHNYDWVIHGHIHHKDQNIKDDRYININMDVWEPTYEKDRYAPIPLEDIRSEMTSRKKRRFYARMEK